MANAFMPSPFASLAGAGQDTLEQILQRRAFEQQLQMQQMQMASSLQNAQLSQLFRADSARRAQEGLELRRATDARNAQRQKQQDELAANERATKARGAENTRRAHDMYFEGLTRGVDPSEPGMLRVASEGNVPTRAMPKKPEKTLEEKAHEAETLAEARARGSKRGNPGQPKATKAAKDNPRAPRGFVDAIQGRIGSTGFETAENAIKSVQGRWQDWRKNYPGLDLNAVRTAIQNAYGQRVSQSTGAKVILTGDDLSRIKANAAARLGELYGGTPKP